MQINPYLFFDSNCEAAFKFYEKVLGGKIEMMMRNEDAPPDSGMPSAPDRTWRRASRTADTASAR